MFTIFFLAYCASRAVQSATFGQGRVCSLLFLSTSHEVVWYHYFVVYMSSLTPSSPSYRPFPVIVIPLHTYNPRIASSLPPFCSGLGRVPSHVTSCFVPHALSSSPCPRRSWIRRHHRIYKLCFVFGWRAYVEITESGARSPALGNVTVFSSIRIFSCFS